ncbi:hypothetical protein [Pedobacter agri]|uniref:hypothetical protein n=1 Tax=Pedobacter agri TaxID=454586 RepID=UPI00292F41B7|nr:hypothetical protein [Pedobacter agri]
MQVNTAEYQDHALFEDILQYAKFYKDLSFLNMHWLNQGTSGAINMDTYIFTSIQGTLESIFDIVKKGRINDGYALLRKYYDSSIINLYTNLYISDHFSIENFVVEKIENWRRGTDTIPSFGKMSEYILASDKVKELSALLYANGGFKSSVFESIRQRCNDHTHYLYYHTVLLNDNKVYLKERSAVLERFRTDLREIFVLHLGYLFYLNDHYMMSSDYLDLLECGERPSEELQYEVAPFVQRIFDEVIKPLRPDIADAIKGHTKMRLS